MSLKALFKAAVVALNAKNIRFAVAGGFAADVYRLEPRVTMDVDFAIMSESDPARAAASVIESLELKPGVVRMADFAGGPLFAIKRKSTPPCMMVGRRPGRPADAGVDLLLPTLPWVAKAIERAQDNLIDFGFGSVPTLTVEDVMLSKLFALSSAAMRAKDMDDLQSIAAADHDVNIPYLAGQLNHLQITVQRGAKPFLPKPILALVRDAERSARARKKEAR